MLVPRFQRAQLPGNTKSSTTKLSFTSLPGNGNISRYEPKEAIGLSSLNGTDGICPLDISAYQVTIRHKRKARTSGSLRGTDTIYPIDGIICLQTQNIQTQPFRQTGHD